MAGGDCESEKSSGDHIRTHTARPRLGPLIGHEHGGSHGTRTSIDTHTYGYGITSRRWSDGPRDAAGRVARPRVETGPDRQRTMAPQQAQRGTRDTANSATARHTHDTHARQRQRPQPVRIDSDGASDGKATGQTTATRTTGATRHRATDTTRRRRQSGRRSLTTRRHRSADEHQRRWANDDSGSPRAQHTRHRNKLWATHRTNQRRGAQTDHNGASPATGETAENKSVARGGGGSLGGEGDRRQEAQRVERCCNTPHAACSVGRDQLMRPQRSGAKGNNKATTLSRVTKRHKTKQTDTGTDTDTGV